ncbi:MAG: hypothetical protein WA738_20140 [Candidatus Angelobacter sp.]
MPVVLKIDPQRRVVYSAFYGSITDEELSGHRSAIAGDPDFNPKFNDIVDFSDVTEADISEATIASMAGNASLFSDSVLHIVVAPTNPMLSLASKFKYLARASRPNFHVVRTRAAAYRLLPEGSKKS